MLGASKPINPPRKANMSFLNFIASGEVDPHV